MELKSRKPQLRFAPAKAGYALAGLLPLMCAVQAQAVEFSFADDEISGSIDTTVSYGQLWRVQGQDKTNNDINTNDGNRNFDTGLVSEVYKITSDLEATYKNYGVFVRGTAFYDTQIMDKRNDYYDNNTPVQPSQSYPNDDRFTHETRHKAGRDAQILDAYVYGNWDIANMPLSARLGKQVFNWGEGIFYRGGINTTNPLNAAQFRLPGSELKEVLVPVEALSFNLGLTDNLSMETFYQFNWKESAIDPAGTYFSETDLFADGGNTAYNQSGSLAGLMTPNPLLGGNSLYGLLSSNPATGLRGSEFANTSAFKVASIGPDINAKNDGQFGVNFKYIAEELNSTEFGAYFINYHSKEPYIYADVNSAYSVSALASMVLCSVMLPWLALLLLPAPLHSRSSVGCWLLIWGTRFRLAASMSKTSVYTVSASTPPSTRLLYSVRSPIARTCRSASLRPTMHFSNSSVRPLSSRWGRASTLRAERTSGRPTA